MLGAIRRVLRDRRGNLSVELGMAMPVLAGLLLSGVEITRYVLINQKVERTSATIADLVAQSYGMSEAEMASLFTASGYVMDPYDIDTEGQVVVSSISSSGGVATINWQRAYGGSAIGVEGGTASLPSGFEVCDGESVVATEVFYDYERMIFQTVLDGETLYKFAFFRPRFSSLETITP